MKTYLQNFLSYFEDVLNPAEGKEGIQQKKSKTRNSNSHPPLSPDSLHIREMVRKQNSFRRNPAP